MKSVNLLRFKSLSLSLEILKNENKKTTGRPIAMYKLINWYFAINKGINTMLLCLLEEMCHFHFISKQTLFTLNKFYANEHKIKMTKKNTNNNNKRKLKKMKKKYKKRCLHRTRQLFSRKKNSINPIRVLIARYQFITFGIGHPVSLLFSLSLSLSLSLSFSLSFSCI